MKRSRFLCAFLWALFAAAAFAFPAFANSSWVWISQTRPYDVLPWVALFTVAAETCMINAIPKIGKPARVCCVVMLANLLSFAAPYGLALLVYGNSGFPYAKYLEHWPSYTVGLVYALVTVAIELPVVYLVLKKDAKSRKRLLWAIVLSNLLTTAATALAERLFCQGSW